MVHLTKIAHATLAGGIRSAPEATRLATSTGTARRAFPGTLDQIRTARHWTIEQLPGGHDHAAAYLTATLVSELATNAVRHSRSGWDGGQYEIDVIVGPWIWIGVYDQGGTSVPTMSTSLERLAESGRGLAMVAALALDWGCKGSDLGWLVWCSVPLSLGRQR